MVGSPMTEEGILACLQEVEDPELPGISIVELGLIRQISWQ